MGLTICMCMCVYFNNFIVYSVSIQILWVVLSLPSLNYYTFFCHLFSSLTDSTLTDKVIVTRSSSRKQAVKMATENGLPIKSRNTELIFLQEENESQINLWHARVSQLLKLSTVVPEGGKELGQYFWNFNIHTNYFSFLLRCCYCYSRSVMCLRGYSSNKLPDDVDATDMIPQISRNQIKWL